jgi:transcriptional regulatory protein GAL4
MFETALGKLFPSGEIEEITRSLLADEMPEDQKSLVQSFMDTNESTFKDALLEPDPMPLDKPLDDGLNDSQSFDEINAGYDMFGVESFLNKNNQFNDPLSSTELEEVFVDTFFSRYHTLYPYVHEAIFRLKFEKRLPSSSSWPVLANIILAFGSWLAPEHHNDLGSQYYKRAQHHFEQIPLSDSGNITTVQALLLLSDFAQKLGHPWESWHYVATAVQKAISLNLHIEPTDPGLTAVDQEIRRRVWWATYCAESCSAKIYGRPLALPEDGLITVRSVTNTHDQVGSLFSRLVARIMLSAIYQDPASPTSAFPTPTNDPTIYSGLIQQSSYHRMANDIYRRVLSTKNVTPQLVHTFEEMINDWHTNNSSLCTRLVRAGSVEQWHMSAWRRQSLCDQSLRLLIHRPLLLRWLQNKHIHNDSALPAEGHSAEAQCRATGLNIARNTIAQTSEYLKKRTGDRMTLAFTLYVVLLVP